MSFLSHIDLDPHIHLYCLRKLNPPETQPLIKQRIHHLLQTRLFSQLLAETHKLKDMAFPDLQAKLQQAQKQSQEEKEKLGAQGLDELLEKLDELSGQDDADFGYIDEQQLNVYRLARIYYDEGHYEQAYEIIKKLERQFLNDTMDIKATWARLYCEIILQDPKVRRTAERLKKKIDDFEKKEKADRKANEPKEAAKSIKQSFARRQEFINLITIAYFIDTKEESFEKYVEFCSDEENSSVLQLVAPHIIRYICVALILNKTLHKNRKFDLYSLVESLRRKIYKGNDPFLEYITALYIDFDFEQAKQKIALIQASAEKDVLLKALTPKIIQNCYFLYYRVYCKVHQRVPIAQIARMINKPEDEAELWILGFIRSLDIEAKIDSVEGVVLSHREEENVNEKYIDLISKTSSFINTIAQVSTLDN